MPATQHLDLNHPDFIANPYPRLAELRERAPIFFDEAWNKIFVTRYHDVAALLKDRRLGRSLTHVLARAEMGWPPPDPRPADFRRYQDNVFMDWEAPDHTRIRSLVNRVFTPRRVEGLRPTLVATTHRLLDAALQRGACEFVSRIAEPLPVIMIAALLGIPESDQHLLRPWSAAIVKMYELAYTAEQADAAARAAREFMEYIGRLAEARRRDPHDDLISGLVQVQAGGGNLSEDELRATCIFLLNAGHEATVNGASLGLLALLHAPSQMDVMKAAARRGDTDFLRTAVDELLRCDSPLPMFERWVLEDMQIDGVPLKAGTEVALLYASGNRDARRFERPDELDLTRTDNPLLTFGLGTHYCLGAPLARLELLILFETLFRRVPKLQLAAAPEYNTGFVIRGLKKLNLDW